MPLSMNQMHRLRLPDRLMKVQQQVTRTALNWTGSPRQGRGELLTKTSSDRHLFQCIDMSCIASWTSEGDRFNLHRGQHCPRVDMWSRILFRQPDRHADLASRRVTCLSHIWSKADRRRCRPTVKSTTQQQLPKQVPRLACMFVVKSAPTHDIKIRQSTQVSMLVYCWQITFLFGPPSERSQSSIPQADANDLRAPQGVLSALQIDHLLVDASSKAQYATSRRQDSRMSSCLHVSTDLAP